MQPDSKRFISLPDTRIYAAGSMGWHQLLNSTFSRIHMKRTFFFSSAPDAVTVLRGLYEKVYPQTFVIRTFSLFHRLYRSFLKKCADKTNYLKPQMRAISSSSSGHSLFSGSVIITPPALTTPCFCARDGNA